MAKKEDQRIVGQIEQEEKKLQEIEERIDLYSAKARELRQMAYTLLAGEPHPDNPVKIADLQRQAHYYDSLAEQATHTERHNQLYSLNILKENAVRLRHTIIHNKAILMRNYQEVEDAKLRAAKMIEDAEQKVVDAQYLIEEQEKELLGLEGVE
ncbi:MULTISPECIES: hypothetical protein [Paenibacillus]|uniref:Flagellar FliJ protein n=1 Tax=Paenibacillus validus TaxID=44253 RepID=A0A7X2ZBJ0_9BACL|nr:hypothetical protein [Paenibacillus validus]MUG71779.1 hypothetical protein [Paenibacillus validus]